MEIISSISKQNKDITKITNDIREIQKTINTFTNTVQRADAVAEDKVYTAANGPNREAAMLDAYRHLSALRTNFEGLIEVDKLRNKHVISRLRLIKKLLELVVIILIVLVVIWNKLKLKIIILLLLFENYNNCFIYIYIYIRIYISTIIDYLVS